MKLTINRSVLEMALGHINRITEKRLASPVLGYVLFEAVGGQMVRLTATNLDMTVVDTMACECQEEGAYCLPAGLLLDIVKKLKANIPIQIETATDKNVLKINQQRASFSVKYMSATDFPSIDQLSFDLEFALNAKILEKAIEVSKVAMSQDSSRVQLNGIFVHHEENGQCLRFVSTDLFRIACSEMPTTEGTQALTPLILSKKTVNEILHLLADVGEDIPEIGVKLAQGQIMIEAALKNGIRTKFSSRLVGGNFPEYKAALDVNNDKLLTVDTAEFVEALERVSTIVSDTSNSVRLNISHDKLQISGLSKEFGSAFDEIAATFESQTDLTICFNNRYLIEILRQIQTEKVALYLNNSTAPAIIKPYDDKVDNIRSVFVLMPVEIVG